MLRIDFKWNNVEGLPDEIPRQLMGGFHLEYSKGDLNPCLSLVGDVDDEDSQMMMMMMLTVCISMLQFIVLLKASRGRAGLFIASSLRNILSL